MRDRNQGASPRTLIGGVLLSAAFLYATWDMTVPACVLYGVIVIATAMLCRAYIARDRAILRADAQQRRADLLAGPHPPTSICELLYSGPRDQLIGHTDRDTVIARLGDRYASGHLDADDFETRTTEATRARTRGELAHVLRDLP